MSLSLIKEEANCPGHFSSTGTLNDLDLVFLEPASTFLSVEVVGSSHVTKLSHLDQD